MEYTVFVQRANVILEVPADNVDDYYNRGFDIIDEKGNIIKKAIPNDVGTLQKYYIQLTAEVARLNEEIANLKKRQTAKKSAE